MRRRGTWIAAAAASLALGAALAGIGWAALLGLPAGALDPSNIASIRIVSRDGRLLREVLSREDGRSTWIDLEQISPHLVQATLAGEDQRFFSHDGIDLPAVIRALAQGASRRRVVSGASTLTMQLVRLLSPAPRGVVTKLGEMVLATKLERRLTKREILRQYLNRAPYGNGTFGVEAAARRYLDKPAAQLSLAEAALLAALPRSPSGYSPYRHRARLMARQRYILSMMLNQGRITRQAYRLALLEPISWEAARRPFRAPHLSRRLLNSPVVDQATWIKSTIDPLLQQVVETAVRERIARSRSQGISNAAVVVVDNDSGDVLAYVGSADFFNDADSGQNDGVLALRQPGSTIKPFTYALALEHGLTPASLLRDTPAHFTTRQGDYAPRNYDDRFHGPVRLRVALGSSYNIPAVRAAEHVGIERLLKRLRAVGLTSLKRPAAHYGLGLTLGNGEVSLQELTEAFSCLARGGRHLPLRLITGARRPDGSEIALPPRSSRQVFDRRVAYQISHILSDPIARVPAFGRHTVLDVGFPAAVKTGTSKDFRDNWTVGYTPRITVGVWVGNFDGSSMQNVSGITGAGPLWAEVMIAAARGKRSDFTQPASLTRQAVCPLSGARVGPRCPSSVEEVFRRGPAPRSPCSFHREVAVDRRNGLLAGPRCRPRDVTRRAMVVYPPRYRAWAHARGIPTPPTVYSPRCPSPDRSAISIKFPVNGDRYLIDPDLRRRFQTMPLEAIVDGWVGEIRWLVNNRLVARAGYPYSARWAIRPGRHTIVAELPGGERSPPVTVTVR